MRKHDWIALVERAYSLDGTEEQWLRGVLEHATPLLDRGLGVVGWTFEWDQHRLASTILATHPDGSPHPRMAFGSQLGLGVIFRRRELGILYRPDRPVITGADVAGSAEALLASRYNDQGWISKRVARFVAWEDWGIRDVVRVLGCTPRGPGVALVGPSRELLTSEARDAQRWRWAMVHLAAGLRLRRRLAGLPPNDDGDAVLTLDGRVHHAVGEASDTDLREALRRAAVWVDRARGAMRREDSDGALEVWRGLVEGRWSLIDRFDRDGRHYLVARKNEPTLAEPRALSSRERVILGYAAMGWSSKAIAYALGVEVSTVSTLLSRGTRKLGVRRVELARAMDIEHRTDLRTATLIEEDSISVSSFGLSEDAPAELTDSERDIAMLAIEGLSNEQIAARRGSALRTVANQLASVYRKLRIGSRAELSARLQRAALRLRPSRRKSMGTRG